MFAIRLWLAAKRREVVQIRNVAFLLRTPGVKMCRRKKPLWNIKPTQSCSVQQARIKLI